MITINNYAKQSNAINFDELPQPLKEGHEFIVEFMDGGNDWSYYNDDEAIKGIVDDYLSKLNAVINVDQASQKMSVSSGKKRATTRSPKKERLIKETDFPATLKSLMPKQQIKALVGIPYNSFSDTLDSMIELSENFPRLMSQDGKGIKSKVHAHYFTGGSDWYITEWDNGDKFFGYAIINDDTENSEFGYIDRKELIKSGAELDFHWNSNTRLEEVLPAEVTQKYARLAKDKQTSQKTSRASGSKKGKTSTTQTTTAAKGKGQSAGKNSASQKTSRPYVKTKPVETPTESIKLIKSYSLLHNKRKTREQLMNLLKRLQKAILEKKITKNDKYAKEINEMQNNLVMQINSLKSGESIDIVISEPRLKKYKEIASSEKVRLSITLLKAFVSLHNRANKENARKLLKRINTAINSGKIPSNEKYLPEVEQAKSILEQFIADNDTTLVIQEQALNGINEAVGAFVAGAITGGAAGLATHLVNSKILKKNEASKPKPAGISGLQSIDSHTTLETYTLPNEIGRFLGKCPVNEIYSITLEGKQGSGKSTLALHIADAVADRGEKSAFFIPEMGSALAKEYVQKEVSPKNYSYIETSDNSDLREIEKAAKSGLYRVIAIDSWQKVKLDGRPVSQYEFDAFRKRVPEGVIVIAIFQKRDDGNMRGGNSPGFDADVNIEVVKVDDSFLNNYAKTSKNRYASSGNKYSMSRKMIIR